MSILSAMKATVSGAQSLGVLDPILTGMGQLANFISPLNLPSVVEMYDAWRAGSLNADAFKSAARLAGVSGEGWQTAVRSGELTPPGQRGGFGGTWAAVLDQRRGRLNVTALIDLYLRGQVRLPELIDRASRNQWWDRNELNDALWLASNQVPSPGDLVRFALKDVWNPAIVQRFSYDAEFPPIFKQWMEAQGADGDARPQVNGQRQGDPVSWSQISWRAHWANISPTQAYEMFQRLRPNRMPRFTGVLPNARAFPLADLQTILQVNDYPVPFRDQLAAIAFHKPRLVDIDRFYLDSAIDANEVYELHLDLGYAPVDARMRTAWLVKRKTDKDTPKESKKLPSRIMQLYKLGRLTKQQAQDRLARVVSGNVVAAYGELANPAPAQVNAAAWKMAVDDAINDADIQNEVETTQLLQRAWKRQYLAGQISRTQLETDMRGAGLADPYITRFVKRLDVVLASGRLMLSTGNVRRQVVEGIMPFETGKSYLANLGWKDPELTFLMSQLSRDMEIELEKSNERAARTQRGRELAQMRQAQLANRHQQQIVRRLNRQASAAQLKRYFTRGIITLTDFTNELTRRGYDDVNIKRLQADAQVSRNEYLGSKKAAVGRTAGAVS